MSKLIMFRTGYGSKIERVEVLRETKQSVFLPATGWMAKSVERREEKVSEWTQYHSSWDQAHTYLIEKASTKVRDARRALEAANGELGNIKGMQPPKAQP